MKRKMLIQIIALAVAAILVLVVGILIGRNLNNTQKPANNDTDKLPDDARKAINFYEDFSKIEEVENLSNVVWNSVRITQIENKMEVNILLNNQSKEQKAEEANLTVNLYDKSGKVVLTKDVKMPEIKANYGTATVNLEFDIEDIMVIYDVKVIANK